MTILPDAYGYGIGAILAQSGEDGEQPIVYASRLPRQSESSYSITEKSALQ